MEFGQAAVISSATRKKKKLDATVDQRVDQAHQQRAARLVDSLLPWLSVFLFCCLKYALQGTPKRYLARHTFAFGNVWDTKGRCLGSCAKLQGGQCLSQKTVKISSPSVGWKGEYSG